MFRAMIVGMVLALTGCLSNSERPSYARWTLNKPTGWADIQTIDQARDFHMKQIRQRCEQYYSYECLELDLWGE